MVSTEHSHQASTLSNESRDSYNGPPTFERPHGLEGLNLEETNFDLQEQGIISPSASQWATLLHLVSKANSQPMLDHQK